MRSEKFAHGFFWDNVLRQESKLTVDLNIARLKFPAFQKVINNASICLKVKYFYVFFYPISCKIKCKCDV